MAAGIVGMTPDIAVAGRDGPAIVATREIIVRVRREARYRAARRREGQAENEAGQAHGDWSPAQPPRFSRNPKTGAREINTLA